MDRTTVDHTLAGTVSLPSWSSGSSAPRMKCMQIAISVFPGFTADADADVRTEQRMSEPDERAWKGDATCPRCS